MDAVHVLDATAMGTDGVVVVIFGAGLITGGRSRRIEPPQQLLCGEIMQHGVDRLHGDLWQFLCHSGMDCLSRLMGVGSDGVEDSQTLPGHTEPTTPEGLGPIVR